MEQNLSRTNVFLNSTETTMDDNDMNSSHKSPTSINLMINTDSNHSNDLTNNQNIYNDSCYENKQINDGYNNNRTYEPITSNNSNNNNNSNNSQQNPISNIDPPFRSEAVPSNIDPNDPYLITQQKITAALINMQLKLGPLQPSPTEFQYPKTQRPTSDSLLCFNYSWYERKLPDGSCQPRLWLSYSKVLNKAFCVYCMLFSGSPNITPVTVTSMGGKISESWTRTGWDTWNNGSRDIRRHEESPQHRASELARVRALSTAVAACGAVVAAAASPYQQFLCGSQAIPSPPTHQTQNPHHQPHSTIPSTTNVTTPSCEILENRKLVRAIVDYLLLQTPLMNGTNCNNTSEYCSTLNRLLQIIGQSDPSLLSTVSRMQSLPSNQQELNLVNWASQIKLAAAICDTISERLSVMIRRRRNFSLLLDPIMTSSNTGWLVVWIRYLIGDNPSECDVAQSLLDVISLTQMPQQQQQQQQNQQQYIHQQILDVLRKYNLDSNNMIGYSVQLTTPLSTNIAFLLDKFTANQSIWPLLELNHQSVINSNGGNSNIQLSLSPPSSYEAMSHHGLLISILLTQSVRMTHHLCIALGLVKQFCTLWKKKLYRNFIWDYMSNYCSSLQFNMINTGPISMETEDSVLDFLVDWYDELSNALSDLLFQHQEHQNQEQHDENNLNKHPNDLWALSSIFDNLQKPIIKEAIHILRLAVGIMRPAFSCCQSETRVIYLKQMMSRFQQEISDLDSNLQKDGTEPPSPKILKISEESVGGLLYDEKRVFMVALFTSLKSLFADDHLELMHEMIQFSRPVLTTSTGTSMESTETVCKLARVDIRAIQREMVDFRPIYREHERTKGIIVAAALWRESNNIANQSPVGSTESCTIIFPGQQTMSDTPLDQQQININSQSTTQQQQQTEHDFPITSSTTTNSSEHYLSPLRLVSEFTSFPNLLAVYKILALFPPLDRFDWAKQRNRIRQYLFQSPPSLISLDDFMKCGLFVSAIEDQTNQLWYLPTDAIIDKFAASSPILRKSLSIVR